MRRFTQIHGLSQARRLPRLGKIRLGVRVKKRAPDRRCKHDPAGMCNYCTYPRETPHFVVPPEVEKVYGREPTALDILLPVDDPEVVFPQAFEYYGSGRGLKCTGNGRTALRYNEKTKEMEQVDCTCPLYENDEGCTQRGHLAVILPKVSVGGIYQIDTGSYNSIVDLNSSLDYVRALIGRFAMVPLKLKREPRETHHDGQRQIHYIMRVELEGDVTFINQLRENTQRVLAGPTYALPAPAVDNPVGADPVVPEEGEPLEPNAAQQPPAQAAESLAQSSQDSGAAGAAPNAAEKPAAQITLLEAKERLLAHATPEAAAAFFNSLPVGAQRMLKPTFQECIKRLRTAATA